MAKIAVSIPKGYGPASGRRLTKCSRAVAIGCERPGRASEGETTRDLLKGKLAMLGS